jgi:hypothetical protein
MLLREAVMALLCIRLLENSAHRRAVVWLFSITVVTISQAAWALPPATPLGAEATPEVSLLAPLAGARGSTDSTVPPDGGTRLDERTAHPENSYAYRVALGAASALGDPGWGTELGGIQEVHGRAQVLPWLGVGLAYFNLTASNNEGYAPFKLQALELNSSWHPLFDTWFDPFLQIGALGIVGVQNNAYEHGPEPRWGIQGQLGANVVLPHFAIGVHARLGQAERQWSLFGLQVEGRI